MRFFDGGDEYNPYFFNRDSREHLKIDVVESSKLILVNVEVCAVAAAERAINYELRDDIEDAEKRNAVNHALAIFQLAARIRDFADREITQKMRAAADQERIERDRRAAKEKSMKQDLDAARRDD